MIMNLAASWYIAMRSKNLAKKPKEIEMFGQSLIAWRDKNGHPVIMERYCSHLGASLAIGKIVDGCIQCPFHHWRFDSSGKCVLIPDVDHIPLRARQATYITTERYGYIWVWYGSKIPLFSLPDFLADDEKDNYIPVHYAINAKTSVQKIAENALDYYHFTALHGLKISDSIQFTLLHKQCLAEENKLNILKEAWFGGLIEASIKSFVQPNNRYVKNLDPIARALGMDAEKFTARIDCWPTGHITTIFLKDVEKFKVVDCITPITENETIIECLLMVKKTNNIFLNIIYFLFFLLQNKVAASEDRLVFNNTKSDTKRNYVKYDIGIIEFRKFYQKWVDKVEI